MSFSIIQGATGISRSAGIWLALWACFNFGVSWWLDSRELFDGGVRNLVVLVGMVVSRSRIWSEWVVTLESMCSSFNWRELLRLLRDSISCC